VASGAWQYPDDVLKAAYWLKQRKAGMNVVDASLRARKHLPYYDEKAPITEFLRNTIMPFATFTAETLRTTLLNSAIDYPVSTVLLLNAPTMINEWQKKRLGISDQEWNKLTKMIPDYLADSGNYVLINKENGKYLLMNTTYSMGVTNVTASIPRPQRTLTENIQSMASHPALDAWTMLKTGKTSLGGEALNAYEKVLPDEASKAYARQLATLLLPSMTPGVGTLSQKVERNLREKKIAPGLMDWELGGVKLLVVDPKQAKRENLKEKKFDVADIKRAMTAVKNQVRSGKLSQERGRELILKLRDVYRKSKKISLIEPGAVEGEVS
jgi:hypothetical protein